ncbi:MAG: hypothetical protein RIM23_03760 [Coleofasciculus sp. G3-WIS-01]
MRSDVSLAIATHLVIVSLADPPRQWGNYSTASGGAIAFLN